MKQSHGHVPFVAPADLSSLDNMVALDVVSVSPEDPIKATLTPTANYRTWDDKTMAEKIEGWGEGYFANKKGKRYREQVLEKDDGTELRKIVQTVADRYIKSSS